MANNPLFFKMQKQLYAKKWHFVAQQAKKADNFNAIYINQDMYFNN